MKRLLVVFLSVFLFGCQNPQEVANTWIGHNVNDLIASWGPPTQMMDNGSAGKIGVWSWGGDVQMPGTATTQMYGSTSFITYNPGGSIRISKTMTFWIDPAGTIYRAAYHGN